VQAAGLRALDHLRREVQRDDLGVSARGRGIGDHARPCGHVEHAKTALARLERRPLDDRDGHR
jgi:hypothetical protein